MNVSRKTKNLSPGLLAAAVLLTVSAARAADSAPIEIPPAPGRTLTAQDQSENGEDRKLTQEIRKAVMASDTLSFMAKNVTIVTVGGNVTLRGTVQDAAERGEIESIARRFSPAGVSNEIEQRQTL
jgi:hypothetical protein